MPSGPKTAPSGLNTSAARNPSVSAGARAATKSSDLNAGKVDLSSAAQPPKSPSVTPQQQASPHHLSSSIPSTANPPAAQPTPVGPRDPDPRFQAQSNGTNSPADPERNSIVWLHERIMSLQQERDSRWQKSLKLMPGCAVTKKAPRKIRDVLEPFTARRVAHLEHAGPLVTLSEDVEQQLASGLREAGSSPVAAARIGEDRTLGRPAAGPPRRAVVARRYPRPG